MDALSIFKMITIYDFSDNIVILQRQTDALFRVYCLLNSINKNSATEK